MRPQNDLGGCLDQAYYFQHQKLPLYAQSREPFHAGHGRPFRTNTQTDKNKFLFALLVYIDNNINTTIYCRIVVIKFLGTMRLGTPIIPIGVHKHFDSFDFSTLYTSIPHDSLKIALTSLVKEAYRVRGNEFLVVDKYGNACWSDTPSTASYKTSIREDSLEMMEYLIDNIYIKVGNKVFRQQLGIPMGTDCAPLLENLFLFYYEYEYMKNLVKDNLQATMKFNGTMRCIDDLLTLNNSSFASKIPDTYPPELDLKKTTESPTTVYYLDIYTHTD